MSTSRLLTRCVLAAATVFSTMAFAQPANDLCTNAEALVVPVDGSEVLSSVASRIDLTAAANEGAVSCNAGAKNTVWYSFTAPVTGSYVIETCNTATNYDSVVSVYTGTCGALTAATGTSCVDQGCFSGAASRVLLSLTQGTAYLVQLSVWSSITLSPTFNGQLRVRLDVVPGNDVCDPGVPAVGFERAVRFATNALTVNDGQVGGNLDGGAGTCYAGIGHSTTVANNASPGRDVVHRFTAPAAGPARYNLRLTGATSGGPNATLYLTDACASGLPPQSYAPPQCIAAANRTSTGPTVEQITCVPLAASQTVFVWADETAQSTAGSAGWPEWTLEAYACDEEVEPNNTPATAATLACNVTGRIGAAGDVDFYALGGVPAGVRVFAMAEGAASASNNFDMRLTTDVRTVEYDDADLATAFGGSAPVIAGAVAPGDPLYVRINHSSATTLAEPYQLFTALQANAPTAETEPNDTAATANSGAQYFTGSITDGGTDVDFYRFSGNAGDVVFAALDQVPDKTDAGPGTYSFVMHLTDSTGNVLVAADDTSTTTTLSPVDGGLTATTPAMPADGLVYRLRASGDYAIRVGKTSGTNPNPYLLNIAVGCSLSTATLANFTPTTGSPSGGQLVTLTGTNFGLGSVVRFGGNVARTQTVSSTQLVVLSPPAAGGGDVAVTVTNGLGLVATASAPYTYEDPPGVPPTLSSLTPGLGPVTGGTVLTLTGSVFRADAGVFFDVAGTVVPAAAVTVNSTTRITATTPPHAEGVANVQVVNFDGLSSTLDGGFTFQGPPTVANITPNTGLTSGGQVITIAGTNFRAGTTVRLGANLATGVTPAADGLSLTASTPSSTVNGPVDVVVRTTDGQQTTVAGGYTYVYAAPTLVTVSPTRGYAVGGTIITLTGANYLPSPTVTVGGAAATNVTRLSGTSVTAATPPGSAGPADIVITNSDGQAATLQNAFTYVPAPVIAAVSPSNGPVQGGTRITLTGSNFTPGAQVRIGGVPAFAVAVSSSTTATATTNAGPTGTHDVELVNPDNQASTLAGGFTLDGAPSLERLSPISGSTAGGSLITLTGSGFLQGAAVIFGAVPATAVTVVSATELVATTPASPLGVVSVTVRNADGQSAALDRSYRFVEPPSLTAVAPTSGDTRGGTVVRLTGAGFSAGATVSFGGTASAQVTLVSATELDAVAPPHAPGMVDVAVTVDGATATSANAFTYTRSAPTISTLAPATGDTAGGTMVAITGTGFASGATVTIGGVASPSVAVVSGELIRAVTPPHAAGSVDVVVANDDGQSGTSPTGFTYVAAMGGVDNSITDGGTGGLGTEPVGGGGGGGGVSCGCTSFDGSMFGFAGLGLVALLSRRRRRR